jgi:2-keto-4-pentenoate hydratase
VTAPDIAVVSRRQLADYDAHQPGRIFEDPSFRLTVDQAYAVQIRTAALRMARGEAIGGYKIGCVSEPVQRQLNIDQPVFGHLFTKEFYRSGVALDPTAFECLAIEGELAVRIAEDITDTAELLAEPARLIESAFAVIELHNNVFRAATRTAEELIANNAFHAGVILPPIELPLCATPEALYEPIAVFRNGKLLGTAPGGSIPGGPLASVISIVRHVVSHGGRLRKGQILITGSPLCLYQVDPGDHILVRGGISGEISVRISEVRSR